MSERSILFGSSRFRWGSVGSCLSSCGERSGSSQWLMGTICCVFEAFEYMTAEDIPN